MKLSWQHLEVLKDVVSELVFVDPLAAFGEIHEAIIWCFDANFNSLNERDYFLLSFVVLIIFSVGNLEWDATISVKRDSEYLAFASYVRLVNLCLLLPAKLSYLE